MDTQVSPFQEFTRLMVKILGQGLNLQTTLQNSGNFQGKSTFIPTILPKLSRMCVANKSKNEGCHEMILKC